MTLLVTGASGFVGSAVVRALLARGAAVRVLVRPTSPPTALAGLPVDRVVGDLTDPASLAVACRGIEGLYHVAADYRLWTRDPEGMLRTNRDGSLAVIRAALEAGARRIVYTSSVAVLKPRADGQPADETTPTTEADMIGPYKRSKFLAEEAVRALVAATGAPVVIVNPSTPIGPGDVRPTPTGRMLIEAACGRMPAYVETGLNLVHVDDVATGHLLAFDRGVVGERYILGGSDRSLSAILAEIARLTNRSAPRLALPHALLEPLAWAVEGWARLTGCETEPFLTRDGLAMARRRMYFSSAKAERDLGYTHRPPEEALADALAWFRDHGCVPA